MKTGKSLQELASEIDRQAKAKADYVVAANTLRMQPVEQSVALAVPEVGSLGLTETGHEQVSAVTDIPRRYYESLREQSPELLAQNVNFWLERNQSNRMLRTLDGRARALLSDKYKRLDNYEIASAVLPILQRLDAKIESCEITERHLYIKAVSLRLRGDVGVNDAVQGGIVIRNSEVGSGALSLQFMIYRLRCLNGMVMADDFGGMRRSHLGRAIQSDGAITFLQYSDATTQALDRAFWMQIGEAAETILSPDHFQNAVQVFAKSKEDRVTGDPVAAVRKLGNTLRLSDNETTGVLRHLIEGGDLNRFGLVNAVTRYSQDVESYDRASELEAAGGKVLTLSGRDWRVIAEAQSE